MATITAPSVIKAINAGVLDDALNTLVEASYARQKAVRREVSSSLKKGDRVRIVNVRPKYLDGLTGVLKSTNGSGRHPFLIALDKESVWRAGNYASKDGTIRVMETSVEPE